MHLLHPSKRDVTVQVLDVESTRVVELRTFWSKAAVSKSNPSIIWKPRPFKATLRSAASFLGLLSFGVR